MPQTNSSSVDKFQKPMTTRNPIKKDIRSATAMQIVQNFRFFFYPCEL